jgi:O-antigen/teichoic acid export membrane protein
MAIALLFDSLTNLPSLFNDGLGHPKRTGFFALARAGMGVILVVTLTYRLGIIGAALGHLIASIFMTIAFLVYVHGKTIPVAFMRVIRFGYAPSLSIAAVCGLFAYILGLPQGRDWLQCIELAGLVTVIYFSLGLMLILEPAHRQELNLRYRRFIRQAG